MRAMIVCFILLLSFCVFGFTMSIRTSSEFADRCHSMGGHVVMLAKGNMLCLSSDGRVIGSR